MNVVPKACEKSKHCSTVACGIALTSEFVPERIAALGDKKDHHTQRFIERRGQTHHEQTLSWFRRAAEKLTT